MNLISLSSVYFLATVHHFLLFPVIAEAVLLLKPLKGKKDTYKNKNMITFWPLTPL